MKLWGSAPDHRTVRGIFICYRRADSDSYSLMLSRDLARLFGRDVVFRDRESIGAGHDYSTEVIDRLRGCRIMLVVIGPRWLDATWSGDDWVGRELAEAFARRLHVIPVLIDGAELPDPARLSPDLAWLTRCQSREIRGPDDADALVRDLIATDPALIASRRRRGLGWRQAG
jgi:hypothetical protein